MYSVHDSDNNRFITKEDVLSIYTEEEIFSMVFDLEYIEEYKYITSPFRIDQNPGCWFGYHNNKLYFYDFGNPAYNTIDCFQAVMIAYNLSSFKEVLIFIIENNFMMKIKTPKELLNITRINKINKQINFSPRKFLEFDKNYWQPYGISKQNLIDDKVFPISKIYINTETEQKSFVTHDICYAYTDFGGGRMKFYFPYKKKQKRFMSSCNQNDIGNINDLDLSSKSIVITKSYKDCRVLRNLNINAVWFQNEGCIPDDDTLFGMLSYYDDIVVFYDNDVTGITSSQKISNHINNNGFKSRSINLPERLLIEQKISDPADLILKDKSNLINFLNENKIINQ